MPKIMVQVKFTIESGVVSSFKAQCAAEGVSMAAVACKWMESSHPAKVSKAKNDTRPSRKKTERGTIALLKDVLQNEENYRDAIPETFQARFEASVQSCEQLSQAISCLEEAF